MNFKTINTKITYIFLFAALFYVATDDRFKLIVAGVSIFLIGMIFIEEGFKTFSGGALEGFLKRFTNTTPKAIFTGFLTTSVVQSSSLVSVIVISFLGAGLMGLTGAIGVIFGSNVGTTTTAWLVSSLGVKIDIAYYALPMISFGVVLKFMENTTLRGIGDVLVGLGFIFLGIGYMKDGFDTLKSGIDLSQYAMDGYLGVIVYICVGIIITIIIQSSSATMALVITALVAGQLVYINAIALAIGANIGTTVTAVLGSITSNADGKRLALAHFIFNIVTAFFAFLFVYQLAFVVDLIAQFSGIALDNYAVKLSVFHTLFNVIGVLIMVPLLPRLVGFLENKFIESKATGYKPQFLDENVVNYPSASLKALKNEVVAFFDIVTAAISHAIYFHSSDIKQMQNTDELLQKEHYEANKTIEQEYQVNIKTLYGEIIRFATLAQQNMNESDKDLAYHLKLSCRDLVEAMKDATELEKNIKLYQHQGNIYVLEQYNLFRKMIASTIHEIETIKNLEDDIDKLEKFSLIQEEIERLDFISNEKIATLIGEKKIDGKIASSIINDSGFCTAINKKLLNVAMFIWLESKEALIIGEQK